MWPDRICLYDFSGLSVCGLLMDLIDFELRLLLGLSLLKRNFRARF